MRFTAFGAARNVTGSKHLLEVGPSRVLLDCGLFQGHREESNRRNREFPFDAASIDAVLLSHAHIDHSGSLPSLVRSGFRGRILATAATADLTEVLLQDSAWLQQRDAEYLNARRRRGRAEIAPLYSLADVEAALARVSAVEYDRPVAATAGITVTFREAGHILGSAMLEIDARERGRRTLIVFTGDLGRRGVPILRDPYRPPDADVLVTESTYGGRVHAPPADARERLARFVSRVASRRGTIVVPAFAVGRTQALVYELHGLMREGRVPGIPIYVDSPLAVRATELLERHPECFDEEMNALVRRRGDPLGFDRVTYVRSADESRALGGRHGPMIVISASGMCEGGRVLHHLKRTLGSRRNAVLIVGYQAEWTLGSRIAAGADFVKILGETHAVRAEVVVFDEFSAHADADGLAAFACGFRRAPRRTIVVHGSEENALALARRLSADGLPRVSVPLDGESFDL
ncbi:MAG: MBL fold metallo-hydrolase [Candidatus Eisenbacteria bacterium]|nr:MBL fold metallo-hydrolase [Candidatus Eisenbacteria bacterium]